MRFLPQTQVLKDLFDDRTLVDEANDSHFAGALGADKRICFVDLSDEVGPASAYYVNPDSATRPSPTTYKWDVWSTSLDLGLLERSKQQEQWLSICDSKRFWGLPPQDAIKRRINCILRRTQFMSYLSASYEILDKKTAARCGPPHSNVNAIF